MCPAKLESVPKVAELPTDQNVLQNLALLINSTSLPEAVISVDAVLNMKTPSGSPCASKVNVPVI